MTPEPVKIDKPSKNKKLVNFDACSDTDVSVSY